MGLLSASVIVPARNASATLPATLDALARLDPVPGGIEVIVADDASTDDTRAIALTHPVVTAVVDSGGVGPGAARNAAVIRAAAPVLAFTDADCVPEPGWLTGVVAAIDAGADLVQGAVEPTGPTGPFDRTVRVPQATGLFETANLAVRREWFDRVGGFEPWLSPRRSKELGEDVWLGWRLRRAGATVAFAPDALVRHAVFEGTPASFVAQHTRLRFFPLMVARIPELRDTMLRHRYFLNARSEAFDLGLLGVLVAIGIGSWLPLLALLPYLRHVWRAALPSRRRAPVVAAARVAADAVGFAALIAGSARAGRLVL